MTEDPGVSGTVGPRNVAAALLAACLLTVAAPPGPALAAHTRLAVVSAPATSGRATPTPAVHWNTGSSRPGVVTVSAQGSPAVVMASGAKGSSAAPWIQPGVEYVFRLTLSEQPGRRLATLRIRATSPAGGSGGRAARRAAAAILSEPEARAAPVPADSSPPASSDAVDTVVQALPFVGLAVVLTLMVVAARRARRRP